MSYSFTLFSCRSSLILCRVLGREPRRRQKWSIRGPTGHHLLGSGVGGNGESRRRPDQLHHQKPGAENQDELEAQLGLQ